MNVEPNTYDFEIADLFCGGGGTSTAALRAATKLGFKVRLTAINHDDISIATHSANHPDAQHYCEDIQTINPNKAIPGGRLKLLLASPECTHFSNARGGKPCDDQSRATPWHIIWWAMALDIENILIENVKEFASWGPLLPCTCGALEQADKHHEIGCKYNRPDPAQSGKYFRMFLSDLRKLGYSVGSKVLCCADFGDPTSRQRIFIQARKGNRVTWPKPTHFPRTKIEAVRRIMPSARAYVPARDILDTDVKGESIYTRAERGLPPLVPTTILRILTGLEKCCGMRFLAGIGGPTGAGRPQPVHMPIGSILTENHRALWEPFLVILQNNRTALPLDEPIPAICTSGNHFGIAEPRLMAMPSHEEMYQQLASEWPFLVIYHGEGRGEAPRSQSLERPLGTIDTSNRYGLIQPTIEPYLINYYGNGAPIPIDQPMHTITTNDRFALITPEVAKALPPSDILGWLDIRYRMLFAYELAAAQSFPRTYHFIGTDKQVKKQIGNAVPGCTAEALVTEILTLRPARGRKKVGHIPASIMEIASETGDLFAGSEARA